jgi:hypothetical protein
MLQKWAATLALESQPQTDTPWEVRLPWTVVDEDDEYSLLPLHEPLQMLVSLVAVAASVTAGEAAAVPSPHMLGLHALGLLSTHLSITAVAQVEVIVWVLEEFAAKCLQGSAGPSFTWTASLMLWMLASTIEEKWPSAGVGRIREAVLGGPCQPVLGRLASAMQCPGAAQDFFRAEGITSGNLAALKLPGGELLLADLARRAVWGVAKWRARLWPKLQLEAHAPDGSASFVMEIDAGQYMYIRR